MSRWIPLLFALSGCAPSVIAAYEADRDEALAKPGPAPTDWEADAVITLSSDLVDRALEQTLAVYGGVEGTIDAGFLKAEPRLKVKSLELGPARCERCSRVNADLGGNLAVHTPLGTVKVPARATLDFVARFEVAAIDETWTLTVEPQTIHSVELSLAGTEMSALTDPLVAWVEGALRESGRQPLAELGSSDLPIRAMRVLPDRSHVRLELLTDTPTPVVVLEPDALPESGWRIDLATDALLDIARAASHEAGPVAREIVAVPTALDIREDRFVLGLRLWRVRGRGWWRDYTVHGKVAVDGGEIELVPERVEDEGHSRGAAWADPLAALGQGVILKSLERALETSIPGTHRTKGDDLRLVVRIDGIEGRGAVVVATGDLEVSTPKR